MNSRGSTNETPPPYNEVPSLSGTPYLIDLSTPDASPESQGNTFTDSQNFYQHAIRYEPQQPQQSIIFPESGPNTCPVCRIGVIMDSYSTLGVILGIVCFPCGIICCCLLKDKACTHCRTVFS